MNILILAGLHQGAKSNGGGWVRGLMHYLKRDKDIHITCVYISDCAEEETIDGVDYISIVKRTGNLAKLRRFCNPCSDDENLLTQIEKIISRKNPDVIQIFGTETMYGLIADRTNVPVIIHIQGIMAPYLNAYFPSGYSKQDLSSFMEKRAYKINQYFAERERRIFGKCKLYMGRTEWDRRVVEMLAPNSTYYRCEELLRPEFYQIKPQAKKSCSKQLKLISVLSSPIYKGHDMILKTADLLRNTLRVDFCWTVVGYHSMDKAERKLGLKAEDLNIQLLGRKEVDDVIQLLQESDIYFHPSYIDNSPNSLCEAQYLGVPVIACNEGGVPSLIEHRKTGILVPCNDPYVAASYIKELQKDASLYTSLSRQEIVLASQRHNPESVVGGLMSIYHQLIQK